MPTKKKTGKKSAKTITTASDARTVDISREDPSTRSFPVVGLGASAGGLAALKSFFAEVPENSGMAYIVVIHMNPKQPSMMPALLQKVTHVPVLTARDGQTIIPDHIYIPPPDKEITVFKGKIQLLDILEKTVALPIDLFLRSLAQDLGNNAAAIILSGTGTDGTLGVKAIKANDGLVLVQSEESAEHDGMPRSAVNTGLVDMILPPEAMAKTLAHYYKHSETALSPDDSENAADDNQKWLNKIFAILRTHIGHDFSSYKANTLLRRISRRMGLNQIDSHEKYLRYMRENPGEVEALFRELLIGVTSFFRDPESFDILKSRILPGLFEQMGEDATLRAWIPGCSTGEEVYSMAIILSECMDKSPRRINLQLFGTDIDKFAIAKAREGIFPFSIASEVSEERLKRFFVKEETGFRIRKGIRDCVVFSVQDVIKDPPFSRLNLLCCRNLLIYLNAKAQKKIMPLFHYTLNSGGILVLGSSETIGGFTNLFETLDKKWKIFRRREASQSLRHHVEFPSDFSAAGKGDGIAPPAPAMQQSDIARLAQKTILDQFAPTAILTDADGDILYVQGRTGKYLETPSGPPTKNILDLAREGLRIELSSAIRTARSEGKKITRRRIRIKTNGDTQPIDLHVCPQQSPRELAGCLLVVFEDVDDTGSMASGPAEDAGDESSGGHSRIGDLEKELQKTRESHQVVIEELESSNEELKSTNEEFQSANEELQSTNEELESSKEELQSLNEELQTINAELQSKVDELSAAHDDMRNLLNSTEIATIFVDNDLRIRRFTNEATKIINLIQTDIGRPLQHVVTNLAYEGIMEDLAQVLKTLAPRETEVRTTEGAWYNMRIIPYRTTDNRIDGAVMTFAYIGDQKKAQEALNTSISEIEQAWELARTVFDMNHAPLLVVDEEGRMVIANKAFSRLMNLPQENIKGMNVFESQNRIPEHEELETLLKSAIRQGENFKTRAFAITTSEGKARVAVNGRIITKDHDHPRRVLLSFEKEA